MILKFLGPGVVARDILILIDLRINLKVDLKFEINPLRTPAPSMMMAKVTNPRTLIRHSRSRDRHTRYNLNISIGGKEIPLEVQEIDLMIKMITFQV